MGTISDSPLGKAARYPEAYDATLLYPVERAPQREALGVVGEVPFHGADRWTAWELAWLDGSGRPCAGIARFSVPCTSRSVVESKSVKLWLVSLNNARFDGVDALRATLSRDLSGATGAGVDVDVALPDRWSSLARAEPDGASIDDVVPGAFPGVPDPSLLRSGGAPVDETLVTRAFRSLCPVTGQPDYATISIDYRGPAIDRAGLLAYLIGYRHHPGFHEHCVESIYMDVLRACGPQRLTVEARFTRRGGVDINPFRSSDPATDVRSSPTIRQ